LCCLQELDRLREVSQGTSDWAIPFAKTLATVFDFPIRNMKRNLLDGPDAIIQSVGGVSSCQPD
jgi:hypothetical protein